VKSFQSRAAQGGMSEATKQIGRYSAWILMSGVLVLMAWKCGEGYQEYRSASRAVDSLAACKTSAD
jgi:hypothetical protein